MPRKTKNPTAAEVLADEQHAGPNTTEVPSQEQQTLRRGRRQVPLNTEQVTCWLCERQREPGTATLQRLTKQRGSGKWLEAWRCRELRGCNVAGNLKEQEAKLTGRRVTFNEAAVRCCVCLLSCLPGQAYLGHVPKGARNALGTRGWKCREETACTARYLQHKWRAGGLTPVEILSAPTVPDPDGKPPKKRRRQRSAEVDERIPDVDAELVEAIQDLMVAADAVSRRLAARVAREGALMEETGRMIEKLAEFGAANFPAEGDRESYSDASFFEFLCLLANDMDGRPDGAPADIWRFEP